MSWRYDSFAAMEDVLKVFLLQFCCEVEGIWSNWDLKSFCLEKRWSTEPNSNILDSDVYWRLFYFQSQLLATFFSYWRHLFTIGNMIPYWWPFCFKRHVLAIFTVLKTSIGDIFPYWRHLMATISLINAILSYRRHLIGDI